MNWTGKPEITVVIPVYNESDRIGYALQEIAAAVAACTRSYEMIVVDDGSSDHTWEVLEKAADTIPALTAIRLSRNFGKEMALCAGLERAAGSAVIVMDGDLQHPPALIAEMVRLWREEHYEIVEAVKLSRGHESLTNKTGAALFYLLLDRLSGFKLKNATDYKLLDEKVLRAWLSLRESATFFRGMVAWLGYRSVQIPFDVAPRAGGGSRWNLVSLAKLAVNAIVSFSTIPLRFVSLLGLAFFCGSVVLGIYTLVQKMQGHAVSGYTTVILLLLIVGSVMMLSLGVIGEYIAAIYREVKGRPRYLILEQRLSPARAAASGGAAHEQVAASLYSGA